MVSPKLVFCFFLFQTLVCGQFTNKHNLDLERNRNDDVVTTTEIERIGQKKEITQTIETYKTTQPYKMTQKNKTTKTTKTTQMNKTPQTDKTPDEHCPPDKSLYRKKDLEFMINNLFKQLSMDQQLHEAYRSQAELVRQNYIQDLNQFTEWFQHKPEHLKHVLVGFSRVRVRHIEPIVKKAAKVLKSFPNLEDTFNEKNNQMRKLLKKQMRYKVMCRLSCEEMEEQKISKRAVQGDYYCSSTDDLNNKITEKLYNATKHLKSKMVNQVSTVNENYKKAIDKIKNNLKNEALQSFARTMYDILNLQDEYYHLVENINITNIETITLSVREMYIELDNKLLKMHKAVTKYGEYCRSCGDGLHVRDIRKANANSEITATTSVKNIVDSLIDDKFNTTEVEIKNDWDKIFNELNELIRKFEKDDTNLAALKPIQEDIIKMTNEERQALEKLKNIAPQTTIEKMLDLVKKSQELLKNIETTIAHIGTRTLSELNDNDEYEF